MGMTMEAQEMQREYKRQYRERNRDRINAQQRAWGARNRDKLKEYQQKYWEKKAETGNIRYHGQLTASLRNGIKSC